MSGTGNGTLAAFATPSASPTNGVRACHTAHANHILMPDAAPVHRQGEVDTISRLHCELPVLGQAHIDEHLDRVLPLGEVRGRRPNWLVVKGEHGPSLLAQSGRRRLEVMGDLCTFQYGRDLAGELFLPGLIYGVASDLVQMLGIKVTSDDKRAWRTGAYRLQHVEVARVYDLGTTQRVRQWITAAAALLARAGYQQVSNDGDQALYVGQHVHCAALSLHGQVVDDRRAQGLPYVFAARDGLTTVAEGKLRVAVSLQAMDLRDQHLDWAAAWSDPTVVTTVIDRGLPPLLYHLQDTL